MPTPRKTIKVPRPPEGFRYAGDLITRDEEQQLLEKIKDLPLKEFEFHGYYGKRRTTSFGWHYDFGAASLNEVEPIPDFLVPLRDKAAVFAGREPENFPHVLVTEYSPGTPIGWHRDRSVFDEVVGVSLVSTCIFRFRRRTETAFERHSLILNPRSAYLLSGPARTEWEHSIPEVTDLRYSITFRSLR
jgi:alkylated DNA repair dioxygenase AlkB